MRSKRRSRSRSRLRGGAPKKRQNTTRPAAFECYLDFFQRRGQNYNRDLVRTAERLAHEGLTCEELLNVNFNTNITANRNRTECAGGAILRAYAADVKAISSMIVDNPRDPISALGPETALGLLHEMYYSIISDGREAKRSLGIDQTFARATALEAIVADDIKCPQCGGEMKGEHLQYRGDLYCVDCDADLDVKTSRNGSSSATAHCKKYNSKDAKTRKKAELTRYATYMENVGGGFFRVMMIDCQSGAETPVSGNIPYDLYYHVAAVAMQIVRPYMNHIKELGDRCG